ncbi:type II toxin-antitoxin system YafQ family toxin [Aetokthonos hydrillicola]|uniref:type II toxin-antitoxin system YafQ family toxin n=1 Tax=Aetokthonos hydrillicola TaxID=1550245 RepID=UPI0036F2B03D
MSKRPYKLDKLDQVLDKLKKGVQLPRSNCNHPLLGYKNLFDVHIYGDWILLYQKELGVLRLVATGTHADIFG